MHSTTTTTTHTRTPVDPIVHEVSLLQRLHQHAPREHAAQRQQLEHLVVGQVVGVQGGISQLAQVGWALSLFTPKTTTMFTPEEVAQ
jgi:hypothetical protein